MPDVQKVEQDLQFKRKFGLSSDYRVLRNEGFNKVLKGDTVVHNNFRVHYISNDKTHARLGIIVRKRVFPSSVHRNFFKRLIRESFRKHSITLCNLDLIVTTRSPTVFDMDEPSKALNVLFSKVKDICASC
jgi:ribonuclease P protein component